MSYVFENGKKKKLSVSKNVSFKQAKVAGAFHNYLSLSKQKNIIKVVKMCNFPVADALSYAHLCEGKIDVVLQCSNKIWDIHALIPIIKAAGGIASTWSDRDAKYAGNLLISSNRTIHKKMLKLLKPAL